ncbi:Serine/threonine protein kinase [Arthrobacter sp. yr096]|uniref:serine/threonine-protein kinase n=1 Tax=Arthrobacter sp. yr096 TaxID=1761750 RepID=UPI0008B9A0A2|nr:serine/threonine-protein kinase [Arthrobacter sp. yr096]SEJ55009.1 Serine/threonine protein kinase [Arthrobacter sp. yr096]
MGNNDEAVDSRVPDSIDDTLDGRYLLGAILGRGAMSAVYQATDLLLGREVAIKIFLPGSGDDSFRARQETEMRLLAAFDHPGLVAAFDAGVDTRNDEERAYLVMERADGRDLRAVLAEGPLTVPEVARIGVAVAGALSQVHGHGVIHRDIKPANILVSDDDGLAQSVKLADFGVALVMKDSRLTATGFTVGTAQYLSPEQAQGLSLTPASDIYSLGLVLLECLTGRAEYPGTPMETASARLHRAPQVPLELPAPLRSLLEAMTDMDPGNRPKAQEVEQALTQEGIQSGRRTAVLPPVPSRLPLRTPTRKQVAVSGLVDFGKRRPRTVQGLAAAAVTIPIAALIAFQGFAPAGNTTDTSLPADSGVSQAEPQPIPAVPSDPAVPVPTEAVPAEAVIVQEPGPATVVQEPAPVPAAETGMENAVKKSAGKSGKGDEKSHGKGADK